MAFLIPEMCRGAVHFPPKKTLVFFAIPAFLYFVSNNTAVHVQVYLDPASFQVGVGLLACEHSPHPLTTVLSQGFEIRIEWPFLSP